MISTTTRSLLRLLPVLGLFIGLILLAAQAVTQAAQSAEPAPAVLLDVRGAIGPATAEYLDAGFAHAHERGAAVIILRIDTPGGLVSSLRDINRAILASPIPIISYVAPGGAQAASAGTYMVYASHVAAMAPGTNLGAATPVTMGGAPEPESDDDQRRQPSEEPTAKDREPTPGAGSTPAGAAGRKAVNDAVAYIRSLAELRDRNADWAEAAVREAASLPASEALKLNVVDIIAPSVDDLLRQADGRTVRVETEDITLATGGLTVETFAPTWRHQLLAAITHPNLAYLLLLIGVYGIIFELMNPGALFPGTIGGISLLTALLALNMLPVNAAGIALLLLGIALMAAEAFVSSFGILGVTGLAAFALGSALLFDGDVPGLAIDWPVIAVAAGGSAILLVIVLAAVVRAHRRPPVTSRHPPVGEPGVVLHWAGGSGTVQVHGETWQARGASELQAGQPVRVADRQGLILLLVPDQPATADFPASPGT
ncbi:MAG: nodulation protein NfeD [Pigmentiphaga sp.]